MIKTKTELNQALRDAATASALLKQTGFKLEDGRDAGFELRLARLLDDLCDVARRAGKVQGVVR